MHFCSSSCLSDRDRCNWDVRLYEKACMHLHKVHRCRDAEMQTSSLFLGRPQWAPRGHTHWGPLGHAWGQKVLTLSVTAASIFFYLPAESSLHKIEHQEKWKWKFQWWQGNPQRGQFVKYVFKPEIILILHLPWRVSGWPWPDDAWGNQTWLTGSSHTACSSVLSLHFADFFWS